MDKSWIDFPNRMSAEYIAGIGQFLTFAYSKRHKSLVICCPCRSCGNRYNLARMVVREHLISNGFLKNYKKWVYHGESYVPLHDSQETESVLDSATNDDMVGMVRDKMTVYLKTRRGDKPQVKKIVEEYNRRVELLSEDERTTEARDQIFHDIEGKDNHGYCRTYGGSIPCSSVYKKDSGPSQTINQLSTDEIEQRIEARVAERFAAKFEQFQSQMFEYMESRGLEARQFSDVASGQRAVRESIGDDTPSLHRSHRTIFSSTC